MGFSIVVASLVVGFPGGSDGKESAYVDHNKLWKILKEMGIPDHLTCLLRNLYAGQGATELGMEQQTSSK